MGNNKQICCNKETLLYITYYIEESRFKKINYLQDSCQKVSWFIHAGLTCFQIYSIPTITIRGKTLQILHR